VEEREAVSEHSSGEDSFHDQVMSGLRRKSPTINYLMPILTTNLIPTVVKSVRPGGCLPCDAEEDETLKGRGGGGDMVNIGRIDEAAPFHNMYCY